MTGTDGRGRCVVVDAADADAPFLRGLPGTERIPSAELADRLIAAGGPVDLVVVGSLATTAVSVVQRVHRLWPDASVAVLAPDPDAVRRQASFAPGVPLDLLIAGVGDSDLPPRLQQLRSSSIERRRHSAVLAAVVYDAGAADGTALSRVTAVGALLEHAPLAVLVASRDGEVLGWNRRAEDLFGLRPAMGGQPVDDVIPGALAMVASAPPPPGPGTLPGAASPPLLLRTADRVEIELSAVSSQTDVGRPVVLLLAVDVTE